MPKSDEPATCTGNERMVLDMIRFWPGVPATVTLDADGGFSVSTPGGWGRDGVLVARAGAAFEEDERGSEVSHEHAEVAARNLISSHFGRAEQPRITVPPSRGDDDIVLMAYIRQQRAKDAQEEER